MTRRSGSDDHVDRIGRLYDRFAPALYRYALMILADPPAADDVVHDVFIAVLGSGTILDDAEHYLRRAVRNQCYSALRRRKRSADPAGGIRLESIGADEDPDTRLLLGQAIGAWPPDQREVLHLKAFEGLTFDEIARTTSQSINTVASRYRYALEKMRAVLGERR